LGDKIEIFPAFAVVFFWKAVPANDILFFRIIRYSFIPVPYIKITHARENTIDKMQYSTDENKSQLYPSYINIALAWKNVLMDKARAKVARVNMSGLKDRCHQHSKINAAEIPNTKLDTTLKYSLAGATRAADGPVQQTLTKTKTKSRLSQKRELRRCFRGIWDQFDQNNRGIRSRQDQTQDNHITTHSINKG
jgi:hypothetical protein